MGQPQNVFLQPTVICGLYCDNAGGVGLNTATFTKFLVEPLHKAPVVEAGSSAANPNSPLNLAGTVSDDGLPSAFTSLWASINPPGTVVFGNASALTTTASFSANGSYRLRLFADDGVAKSFDDLTFVKSAFLAWQKANFAGGALNPQAAADADPDQDGESNMAEYLTGTDPNVPGGVSGTLSLVTIGSDQFLRITIPKSPSATDATVVVEAASGLNAPTWSSAGLIIEQNTPTLLQVRDNVPTTSSVERYLRGRISVP